MFTLEDLDLTDDLAYLRENAARFLPGGAADLAPGGGETAPEADALAHPQDYLIVGFG